MRLDNCVWINCCHVETMPVPKWRYQIQFKILFAINLPDKNDNCRMWWRRRPHAITKRNRSIRSTMNRCHDLQAERQTQAAALRKSIAVAYCIIYSSNTKLQWSMMICRPSDRHRCSTKMRPSSPVTSLKTVDDVWCKNYWIKAMIYPASVRNWRWTSNKAQSTYGNH